MTVPETNPPRHALATPAAESAPGVRWTARDRRATAAVAVQFAVNGAFFASFLPRLPELRDELGISTGAIGALLTAASAVGLVSSALVRPIIARFGTRRVLFVGGLILAAGLALLGQAGSWPTALAGLIGLFLVDVFVDVAMNMQGSWLSARRHHPIMNRLHGLWSAGSVVGGLVSARLAHTSLALHLGITAVALAVLSSLVATQVLAVDETHGDGGSGGQPLAGGAGVDRSHRRGVSPTPLQIGLFAGGLAAVLVEMTAIGWAAFRITDDLHGSAATAGVAYVAVVGGMTVGRFGGDHLAQRWGSDRLMRGSAVLAMAALLVAGLIGIQVVTVAAFAAAGLGIATLTPRLYDLAARAGQGSAAGLGVLTAGIRTASILAPASVAAMASVTSVGLALALAGIVSGLGFLAATRSLS
ncbi:MAG: MFS transporter [Acidimicrobiales bacterium]